MGAGKTQNQMSQVLWSEEATSDLVRLFEFLAPKNPEAAQKAVNQIFDSVEMLSRFPEAGRRRPSNQQYRELPIRFGTREYVARYRIRQDNIYIIRIWHGFENR